MATTQKISMTFTVGSLTVPPSGAFSNQQYYNEFAKNLVCFISDSISYFYIGSVEPSTDVGPWLKDGIEWRFWNAATSSYSSRLFQPGEIIPCGDPTIDETRGWLICDGRSFPFGLYPDLYAAIGDNFGVSDPGTFKIPDLRAKVPIGAGTGTGLTARTLGVSVGVEAVTLSLAEMATHAHDVAAGIRELPVVASDVFLDTYGRNAGSGGNVDRGSPAGAGGFTHFPHVSNAHPTTADTPVASGGAHNNIQPYVVVNFKIKY